MVSDRLTHVSLERIIQTGKKKLVLDHLIVQKINDDDDNNDVQSMLTFGAKALFDETNDENRDINCKLILNQMAVHTHQFCLDTEQDVQRLIEKTELEGDKVEASDAPNNAFAFAKVWSSHRDALDDMPDEVSDAVQDDSWAQTLAKIQEEQQHEQAQEKSGRGVRRKAAQLKVRNSPALAFPSPPICVWYFRRRILTRSVRINLLQKGKRGVDRQTLTVPTASSDFSKGMKVSPMMRTKEWISNCPMSINHLAVTSGIPLQTGKPTLK